MKFIITGSGGCVCTPKPLCQCAVCTQARRMGYPYRRCGCSLYLEDIALLVDTPEDIAVALNNADIRRVDNILYSHWDPDHTLGMRVMEQLRLEWLDAYEGKRPESPINVYAQPGVMDDINAISSRFGSLMGYYERMGLIRRSAIDGALRIGDVKLELTAVPSRKAVTVFTFESAGRKLVYAPCDCLPFPDSAAVRDADVLIMGNTFIGETLKNGRQLPADSPLRRELYSFEAARELARKLGARELVLTHLEEGWGKSYDDYRALESQWDGVRFAYDGMTIEL